MVDAVVQSHDGNSGVAKDGRWRCVCLRSRAWFTRRSDAERESAPNGIRIRVYGLKGRCPSPLDDGAV